MAVSKVYFAYRSNKAHSERTAHVVIYLVCVGSRVYRLEWKFVCTLHMPEEATVSNNMGEAHTGEAGTTVGQRNWGSDILHNA